MQSAPFQLAAVSDGLVLRTAAGTHTFAGAVYDAASDRLSLQAGPPTAAMHELTPEGHLLAIAAPDRYLAGLELVDVSRRLMRDGSVTVTLGPGAVAELDARDLAHLLTTRRRTGRFSRAA